MGLPLEARGLPSDFGGAHFAWDQQPPLLLVLPGRGDGTDGRGP